MTKSGIMLSGPDYVTCSWMPTPLRPQKQIHRAISKSSRQLAEKKLASLYAGVVRTQSFGGPKAPTDPVAMVILRLARKAVISRPEIAAASKADRLATINRLAAEYAKEHDPQLRPRAQKIVALENHQAEPAPVKKHEPMPTKKKKAA